MQDVKHILKSFLQSEQYSKPGLIIFPHFGHTFISPLPLHFYKFLALLFHLYHRIHHRESHVLRLNQIFLKYFWDSFNMFFHVFKVFITSSTTCFTNLIVYYNITFPLHSGHFLIKTFTSRNTNFYKSEFGIYC